MLKRVVTLLLIAAMLTATVSAGVEIKNYQVDNNNHTFSLEYDATKERYVSVGVYDVTKVENATVDTQYSASTPIIALDENQSGRFELKFKNDFTGKAIVALGCSDGTYTRTLLEVDNGVTRSVTIKTATDGLNDTLKNGESMKVDKGASLTNSVISAETGTLTIGTTNVKGRVRFDAKGQIAPASGDSIILDAKNDGVRSLGFLKGIAVENTKNEMTLTITGGGKKATKAFKTLGMTGNFVFGAVIKGVPESVSANEFTITIE